MNSYEIEEFVRSKLLIPAGKCPFVLEDTSFESVEDWILKIEKKLGPSFNVKPTVFRYWARRLYCNDPEKLEEVNHNISLVTNSTATLYDYMIGREQ